MHHTGTSQHLGGFGYDMPLLVKGQDLGSRDTRLFWCRWAICKMVLWKLAALLHASCPGYRCIPKASIYRDLGKAWQSKPCQIF